MYFAQNSFLLNSTRNIFYTTQFSREGFIHLNMKILTLHSFTAHSTRSDIFQHPLFKQWQMLSTSGRKFQRPLTMLNYTFFPCGSPSGKGNVPSDQTQAPLRCQLFPSYRTIVTSSAVSSDHVSWKPRFRNLQLDFCTKIPLSSKQNVKRTWDHRTFQRL